MSFIAKFFHKENKENGLVLFSSSFVLFLIFWVGLIRHNFNADTIFHMVVEDADILTNIEAGRYIISLGDFILYQFGLRTTTNISITMAVTFLLFSLAMVKTYRVFEDFSPKNKFLKLGFYLGTQLVFLNILFSELLMFNEYCVYFAFSYFMAAMGVEKYTQKKYFLMMISLILATTTYQYTMIFASILCATYLCIKHKGILSLQAVREEFSIIFICMGLGLLDVLSVFALEKLGVIRSFGKSMVFNTIFEKLGLAYRSFLDLNKSGSEIFPNLWLPLLFALFLWFVILFSLAKKRELKKAWYIFIVYVGSTFLLYVIPLIQTDFYFPCRMSFCFFLIQGMLILMAFSLCEDFLHNLLVVACIGYLMLHFLFSQFIVANRFVSNTLDRVYANMIYQEIQKYEANTGINVTGLSIAEDSYCIDYYDEVGYKSHQINERALGTVTYSLMEVMCDRKFEHVTMPDEIYSQYFEGKNWDYFDLSEQFIIIDNVAYWCIF